MGAQNAATTQSESQRRDIYLPRSRYYVDEDTVTFRQQIQADRPKPTVRNRESFVGFLYKSDRFTKTDSGQTGKHHTKTTVSAGGRGAAARITASD